MKRASIGSICIFGVKYIIRTRLSFSSRFKPNLLEKGIVSWIILSFDLLENPYVGLGVPLSPISMRIFEI